MMLRRSFTPKALVHLAAILVILVAVLVYNTTKVAAHVELESPLLVSTRTNLRLCAQVSPAAAPRAQATFGRLTASLNRLRNTNPHWKQEYGDMTEIPVLETTCRVKVPTSRLNENDINAVGLGNVTNPGPFRTVFLVLDEQTANNVLGERKASLAPYEMMVVSEHENAEVTNALVVRESAIEDPQVIEQFMAIASGLEPNPAFAPRPPTGERSSTVKPQGYDAGQ